MDQHLSPVSLFYAYAHEDEALRSELEKHLRLLQHQGLITTWHDRQIVPGTDWAQSIGHHLSTSSIILLLISPDFLASSYCYNIEMQQALERHQAGEAIVIPIILRPVDWQHSLFAHLQCLPRDGKALTEWDNRDAAFRDIAEGLRLTIERHVNSFPSPAYRNYLHWLIERNYYLDPRGTFQIQRPVQVKMEEVYISLKAMLETKPKRVGAPLEDAIDIVDNLLEKDLDIQHEDRLMPSDYDIGISSEIVNLDTIVERDNCIVILGNPGYGKTTLLRYLALRHAQALLNNQQDTTANIGPTRFPILIRIADYAEYGISKGKSLSEFLVDYCSKYECPKAGLAELLKAELKNGNSLVLMDGLDEIVNVDDRLTVVRQIEDFVRVHSSVPNRFIVTSRVAGYNNVHLSGGFTHYIIQEMDDAQIRSFLEAWCLAIEIAETPMLSMEMCAMSARSEINGIMHAIQSSSGVRRLAANPLLLRTLALIHRSGAQLPQKRIELYKITADVLARTWRTAQGVPESALVDDNYLTRLLSKLAYWLHINKPTGLATEQEVYRELGQEWARIKGGEWDEDHPDIRNEVKKFLQAVREHTGLFVERSPKRYGFMHLTFEEYYAARYLVARSKTRIKLIHKHLHFPRWDEPILLALGFVGLDTPEDAAELLETAVLAQGEEAQELGLAPSKFENLLGRDYLFALRCLGDQIPVSAETLRKLTNQLLSQLLYYTDTAQFYRYRQALGEKLHHLKGTKAGTILLQSLLVALKESNSRARSAAAWSLGQLSQSSSDVIAALVQASNDNEPEVREQVAWSLGQLSQSSSDVIAALVQASSDTTPRVRVQAIKSLMQLGLPPDNDTVAALLRALRDKRHDVQMQAARALGQVDCLSNDVKNALLHALVFEVQANLRHQAAHSLRQLGLLASDLIDPILEISRDSEKTSRYVTRALASLDCPSPDVGVALLRFVTNDEDKVLVREDIAYGLGRVKPPSADIVSALLCLIDDNGDWVRTQAARSLGRLGLFSSEVLAALLRALNDDDDKVRYSAANSLGKLGQSSKEIVPALLELFNNTDFYTTETALALAHLGQVSNKIIEALVRGVQQCGYSATRSACAYFISQIGPADKHIIEVLWRGRQDDELWVYIDRIEALVQLGRRFPTMKETIEDLFIQTLEKDRELDKSESKEVSTYQYTFNGLWLLVVGGELSQASWWRD